MSNGAVVDEGPAAVLALRAAQVVADLGLEVVGRSGCRGNGGTGCIRTGSSRRPRARSTSARRRATAPISARVACTTPRSTSSSEISCVFGRCSASTLLDGLSHRPRLERPRSRRTPCLTLRRALRVSGRARHGPARREPRGRLARTDRSLDRRRQAGRGPIACQDEIVVGGLGRRAPRGLGRRRREGRPLLLDDLPAGQFGRKVRSKLGDLRPDLSRQVFARHVEQPVGPADRDRIDGPDRRTATPSGRSPRRERAALPGGGTSAKCALTMERNALRRAADRAAGRAATQGGSASTTAVLRAERARAVARRRRPPTRPSAEVEAAQAPSEADLAPRARQIAQRRIDEGGGQAARRDERPAGLAAGAERLAQDRARRGPTSLSRGSVLRAASSTGCQRRS